MKNGLIELINLYNDYVGYLKYVGLSDRLAKNQACSIMKQNCSDAEFKVFENGYLNKIN